MERAEASYAASHRCAVGPTSAAVLREVSGEFVDLVPENAQVKTSCAVSTAPSGGGHVVIVREQASGEVRIGIEHPGG